MIQLSSIGTLACVVLIAFCAAELVMIIQKSWSRALEVERGAQHLFHGPDDGCPECEDK